jgi:hypothetical protein
MLRSSRCLSTIQTRPTGTKRTLCSRESSTGQGHRIRTDRIPGPQNALRRSLAVERSRILAKFCDQARTQWCRSLSRAADNRSVQRVGLGLQNRTSIFNGLFQRLESGRVLSIVRRRPVATTFTIDA